MTIRKSKDPWNYTSKRRLRLGLPAGYANAYPRYQTGVTLTRNRVDDVAAVTNWLDPRAG